MQGTTQDAADCKAAAAEDVTIVKVDRDTPFASEFLHFVENCSWTEVRDHIAGLIRNWEFTEWETMFAAVRDGKIVGMASLLKTDYYPLPEIFPWVSCVFVEEKYRGERISGQLIDAANRYAKAQGFTKTYIPTEYTGLYERYGYTYVRDIVNYGGGTDRLYVKML
ncbi:MAG: GNAT family N-acetyltransferase [Lachnospiraceae bacterium]|nr:GNAT family N-acetyltransferase [Lachnospiraceae bacterium]